MSENPTQLLSIPEIVTVTAANCESQLVKLRSQEGSPLVIQSGPQNPSGNLDFPFGKTKTFVGTYLVVFFRHGIAWFTKSDV